MSRPARGDHSLTSELDLLQRKYRSMELARRDSLEDNSNTLRMQRAQIEKLKKDHERVKEELALETRQAKLSNNLNAAQSIAKLQDQGDIYQRKIEVEKKRIHQLNSSLLRMSSSILEQRKLSGGINAARDHNLSTLKNIRILENRLDKALIKFNESLAWNKNLREIIDNLRRERVVFDGIYRKLEKELHEKKIKMKEIIQVSNACYIARDQAQAEMNQLSQQAEEKQNAFTRQWEELSFLIDKDNAMKQILHDKEVQRSHDLLKAVQLASNSGDHPSSLSPAQEEELHYRRKFFKTKQHIAREKHNIATQQHKVSAYENAFAQLQKSTGIEDVEKLVNVFLHAEDENFHLFNFVNELNTKIEAEEDDIAALQKDLSLLTNGSGKADEHENIRKTMIGSLTSELSSLDQHSQAFDRQTREAVATINVLTETVKGLGELLLGEVEVDAGSALDVLARCEKEVYRLMEEYEWQKGEREDEEREERERKAREAGEAEKRDEAADEQAATGQVATAQGTDGAEAEEKQADEEADQQNDEDDDKQAAV